MNKFFKLLLFNILIMLFIFFGAEYHVYLTEKSKAPEYHGFLYPYYTNTKTKWNETYKKIERNEINGIESGFRITQLQNNMNNGGILLFGCSYTYGAKLNDDETFSYKLQKLTNRLVLNRGFSGWGPSAMLYQLRKQDFIQSLTLNIKDSQNHKNFNPTQDIHYVLYTFIGDHVKRNYIKCMFFDDKFMFYKKDKKNNSLNEKTNIDNIYWHTYLSRKYYFNYIHNFVKNYNEEVQEMTILHFTQSHKIIKKLFPNARFIIFVYDGDDLIKPIQSELESDEIEIIYLSELSDINFKDPQYVSDEAFHPTEKAWEIIVPLLIKRINL